MVTTKRIITVAFMALALAGSACASMTPVSLPAVSVPSSSASDCTSPQPGDAFGLGVDASNAANFDPLLSGSLPEAAAGEAREAKPVQVLADHQSSLSLCLYVLMGVGLCKTVPSVRKLSLGCIPDWYHDGGPSQVGHSHAVGPNLCPVLLVCFVQPDSTAENITPNYDRGTIASPVRDSLFTPNLLASRGPPLFSC
jgi:hypothetical protein